MKRFSTAVLLALLLCGCVKEPSPVPVSVTEALPSPLFTGYYLPGSDVEISTKGAVRAYPLDIPDAYGLRTVGDRVLVLSLEGTTRLTILSGDTLAPSASVLLPFFLSAEDLVVQDRELLFYDPTVREIHVLSDALTTAERYTLPDNLIGNPLLSPERNTVYYCTADALRAWDPESNIQRCVKDMSYEAQSVTGLHMEGTILECTISDNGKIQTLFLSAEDGSLLHCQNGEIDLKTYAGRFYAAFPSGSVQALAFGGVEHFALTPRTLASQTFFVPANNSAVSVSSSINGILQLDHYRLDDGRRTAKTEFSSSSLPKALDTADAYTYLLCFEDSLCQDIIYRWESDRSAVSDPDCYTGVYYSRENPDVDGLARCQTYANIIGQQHGIQVKIGEDAAAVEPWDYDLEAEYQVPVLEDALRLLEQWLSHYPDQMMADTASHFSSLTICLVQSIHGSAESGSLDSANGIQFFEGKDAYVVIRPGPDAQQAFYHEMFHVMETHLLICSTALDRWSELNPTGFRYDYNYITNKTRDAGIYLRGDSRAFVDTYSMSFPKEDKARIMEYAMMPGNEVLFRPPIMQAKLRCMSNGLREAYGLKDFQENLLWEQYLER